MVTPAEVGYARAFPIDGLVRRWRSIAVWALVGLLLGSAALFLLPRAYASTASVIVEPSLGNPYSPTDAGQSLDNLITEEQVAVSTPVAEKVRQDVAPSYSAKALRGACAAATLPNSQIIEITCSDPDRTTAREITQGFAEAFLAYRGEVSKDITRTQSSLLDKSIAETTAAIDDAVRKLRVTSPATTQYQTLKARIVSANQTLAKLQSDSDQIRLSQSQPGRVLSPAGRPRGGFGKVRLAYPLVGLVVLGGLGLLIAARNALRDDRVYTAADLNTVGPPVLAVPETLRSGGPAMDDGAAAIVSAAFRGRLGPDRTAVVLTSIGPGLNTVRGALRIVESLRSDSIDVVLVELRESAPARDHQLVPVGGGPSDGSVDLVRDPSPEPGGDRLEVLECSDEHDTDAPVYKISAARLERRRFRAVVDGLGARHELVVIAGAVLSEPSTLDAVEAIGDTMLVVPMGRYNENEVRSAVDQVRLFHGRVIALVTG